MLQSSDIIFRQLCDIYDKYATIQAQLQHAYINLAFLDQGPHQLLSNSTVDETNRPKFQKE